MTFSLQRFRMWTQFVITILRERNARTYHNKILFLVLKVRINNLHSLESSSQENRWVQDHRRFQRCFVKLLYFCFLGIVVKKTFPLEWVLFSWDTPLWLCTVFLFGYKTYLITPKKKKKNGMHKMPSTLRVEGGWRHFTKQSFLSKECTHIFSTE